MTPNNPQRAVIQKQFDDILAKYGGGAAPAQPAPAGGQTTPDAEAILSRLPPEVRAEYDALSPEDKVKYIAEMTK